MLRTGYLADELYEDTKSVSDETRNGVVHLVSQEE